MQKNSRLAWGITLLTFGILFLLRLFKLVPAAISNIVFNPIYFPLIVGFIFLLARKNRIPGLVTIVVSLAFIVTDMLRVTNNVSVFVWPVLLIVAGLLVLFNSRSI